MDRQIELSDIGLLAMTPLIICFMGVWLSPWVIPASVAFDFREFALLYGALIATWFAGFGAHASIAKPSNEGLISPMIAAVVAWVGALPQGIFQIALPNLVRLALVIGALVYLLMRDLRAVSGGLLPPWYGDLRQRLTFWACISLAMVMARLLL